MSDLADELWRLIIGIGIKTPNLLNYKDLCCLSITCRRLRRLSNEEPHWSSLLYSDFPQNEFAKHSPSSSSSSSSSSNINSSPNFTFKTLYKIRLERDRTRKLAAHRRAVFRIESQIAEHSRKMQEIQLRSVEEAQRMKATVSELSDLCMIRQASVALNVWQPEIIHGRHMQMVEQCVVPADSRIHALEMELRLCKQQIASFDKAYKDERKRFDAAKEQLTSIKYHPLRNYNLTVEGVHEFGIKRKKLKKEHQL